MDDVTKHDAYAAALAQDTHETDLDMRRMPALQLLQGKSKPVTAGISPPGKWWSAAHSSVVKGGQFALISFERVWQIFVERKLQYRTHDPEDPRVLPLWKHRALFVLVYGPFGIDGMRPCPLLVSFHGKGGWNPGQTWLSEVENKKAALGLAVPCQLYEFDVGVDGDNFYPIVRYTAPIPVDAIADVMKLQAAVKGMVLAEDFDIDAFRRPDPEPEVVEGEKANDDLPF